MRIGDKIGTATVAAIAGQKPKCGKRASWTMTIPGWRPRSLNELLKCHYMTAYKYKQNDKKVISSAKIECGIPDASCKRRVDMRIILHGRDKKADQDNVYKSLLDALVAARLLVNDTPQYVELGSVEYERGKRGTVITLTDV